MRRQLSALECGQLSSLLYYQALFILLIMWLCYSTYGNYSGLVTVQLCFINCAFDCATVHLTVHLTVRLCKAAPVSVLCYSIIYNLNL